MDGLGIQLSRLNYLFDLSNYAFSCCGHICVEVTCCLMKLKISHRVCLLGFYQRKLTENGLLFEVFDSLENFGRFGRGNNFWFKLALWIFPIFDYIASSLNNGAYPSGGVEGWNASPSRPYLLGQGSLGADFQFNLPVKVLLLACNIFPQVRKNHSLYLPRPQQHAQSPVTT